MKNWLRKNGFALVVFVGPSFVLTPFILLHRFPTAAETAHEATTRFHYTRDEKTGLCFVTAIHKGRTGGFDSQGFTNVPCTTEVEALLGK